MITLKENKSCLNKWGFYRNSYSIKNQNMLPLVQLLTAPLKKELFHHRIHGLLTDSAALETFLKHEYFALVQKQILQQTLAKKLAFAALKAQNIAIKGYARVFQSMDFNSKFLGFPLSAPEAALIYLKNTERIHSFSLLEIAAFSFFNSDVLLSNKLLNLIQSAPGYDFDFSAFELYFEREKRCVRYLNSLLISLCGVDMNKWGEAYNIGLFALNQKLFFWDSIATKIEEKN